ncbi:ion transporter [Flavobacteriales bacterium]|nr:ion transporter [Flavobacteriales bacterium]
MTKKRLHQIIFETDTRAGKNFDIALLWLIVNSVIVVMLESVSSIKSEFQQSLFILEWIFTGIFTLEYILRLYLSGKSWKYALSFFGLIDLLSILPSFLSFFIVGTQSLMIIRIFRLLRVFRVLKLAHFLKQSTALMNALKSSKQKITVFIFAVLSLTILMGTFMYLIEGGENGFTSIPRSVYWAIVTLTTVGYGDIAPQTVAGQTFAAVIMILGYGIIAVPTGIVGAEIAKEDHKNSQTCKNCGCNSHEFDAEFCKMCGSSIV